MNDFEKVKGNVKVFKRFKGGDWNLVVDTSNLITNLGLNLCRDNVFGTQSYSVGWGGVSDDSSTPSVSDSSLGGNEIRVSLLSGYPNNDVSKVSVVQYFIDGTQWVGGSPSALTSVSKAGLYYQSSGSFLFNVASFDSISVDSNVELLVQWSVSFDN